ncbi:MAG: MBL fold metallo-hydrolase [Acidaminococcales bacterium]|jgi:phosphoribosyl 1,2-cyclic phosphodiesterase|nr:MBL fold metallo-hydrolase [Acidaminococcales bacterium]
MTGDSFRVHVLASGSKGNAVLIGAGRTTIMIDAGISARRLDRELGKLGLRAGDLSGIFITHEHTDHVKGLPVFVEKSQVQVFAREETWLALEGLRKIHSGCRRLLPMQESAVGDLSIRPFAVSHDAAAPVGFNIFYRRRKCSLATDLGFAGEEVKAALSGSDVLIIEANHDEKMLASGCYPPAMKKRISGGQGHLSNAQAGRLLAEVYGGKKTQVFLAHLSQENNRPELAQKTVADILAARGAVGAISIYVTSQDGLVSNCGRESDVQ